jgi:Flp pilus assembly protein TadD
MKIIHPLDDFFNTLFPNIGGGSNDLIISKLESYYSYGPFKPSVTIQENQVIVDIDTPAIIEQEADYRKTVALCEKGKYSEAKPILNQLLYKNPTNSEYHRIMGQILSDEGNQEDAINYLIDALRWDSKNGWALMMLGNIFAKFKNDIDTAMKYYDQALIVKPNDNITMSNIGANLMQQKKFEEAKKYFLKAVEIDDKYPNTHFALGMIAEMEGDLDSAFYSTVQAIKLNPGNDVLFQNSVRQAFEIANKVVKSDEGKIIYRAYQKKLEYESDKKIEIVQDDEISTAAKIEFAEYYNRENHIIKFKQGYPAVEHLIMHEMVHLDFVIQARNAGLNQMFFTTDAHKALFNRQIDASVKWLKKNGYTESSIEKICSMLFSGLNLQMYNTPIDLFIENYLYSEYSELRPYQFLSIYALLNEGIQAVTLKKIVEVTPPFVLSKSKILNLINALQFKDLFGIDLTGSFKPTQTELNQARQLYNEYLEYKEDKEPAEEYELIQNWAEDLKLEKFFELQSELQYRKNKDTNAIFESLQNDPLGIQEPDPEKERLMKKFQESQKSMGTNMAVMFFMIDALQFFEGMPTEKIKKIAFEIALQGTQGYSPDKKDYTINLIPGKTFSGYHILAYYYVSWAISAPEMLSQLQLPFDNEYKMAKSMHIPKQ